MKKPPTPLLAVMAASFLSIGSFGLSAQHVEAAEPEKVVAADSSTDWRENYAYSMGVAAMHYAYPYWRMAHVRYNWTELEVPAPDSEIVATGALNQYWHAARLVDHNWTEGGSPNNDTLYSFAWVNVADEPVIFTVPPMDRYYTFQFAGFNSDNFAYVSEMKHGREGGDYALLPRGWQGSLPEGVTAVGEVPSPWITVIGRAYVSGAEDIPAVRELQKGYGITSLSQWGQAGEPMPQPEVFKPYDKSHTFIDEPMAVWKTINRALTENPPVDDEVALMSFFRELNIGPGFDLDELDEATKRGLARAAVDGFAQIQKAQAAGAGKTVGSTNGWIYVDDLGHAGAGGDFLSRTLHQSYAGIVSNDSEEAMYYGSFTSHDGAPMDGGKNYRIELSRDSEPDVNAFWSLIVYDGNNNLVANEINRYSLGDRTEGLVRNADGGLTIALQHERPTDPEVNWLPTPEGRFWMVLRAYQPSEAHIDGEWQAPPVIRVD